MIQLPSDMMALLARLPEVKVPLLPGEDLTKARCACNKLVDVTSLRPIHTGRINALDNVCTGCMSHSKGLAILVCRRCRRVVARVGPHKDKLGFSFVAGQCYHITHCPVCVLPGDDEGSTILEQFLHHRDRGMRK